MERQPPITREDHDDIAVLTLDHPNRSLNVIDEEVIAHLAELVDDIEQDTAIRGVVLASGKPGSFGAGADIAWLPELAERADAEAFLGGLHDQMFRIAGSSRAFVAAIEGSAFGGALEIALSMHGIVARSGAVLGLPEVKLGLIPGGGGTQLLRRWLSTADALDLLLSGRTVDAASALDIGLVTTVVDSDDDLVGAAIALARDIAAGGERPDVRESSAAALDAVAAQHGDTPASAAIIDAVRTGAAEGLIAGSAVERTRFLDLLRSAGGRAGIHLFLAESAIRRRSRAGIGECDAIGLVGGGQMGSGIAATAVAHGLAAIVRDVSNEALGRSYEYLTRVLARQESDHLERDRLATRWSGTTGWVGLAEVDAIIEAVFELPELKQETLRQIEAVVGEDTLIATNTSAIPVSSLAKSLARPERFLGMHFFSPVERMPLVELIPHASTSPDALTRALAVARRLGKVPVVVSDRPGFFTSRVYARWLIEGIRLLLDGIDPADIERVARTAGFPAGPLQAHDEATLDLILKASIIQVAEQIMGDRIDVASVRTALETLIAAGVQGRRHGAGFYRYEDGRRAGLDPDLREILGVTARPATDEEIRDRLLLAFATECFLCWDDGTLLDPSDGDVASVLGIGFPRSAGGPFHWADEQGLDWVEARCLELGTAFPAGARLPELAASGGRFDDEKRRPE